MNQRRRCALLALPAAVALAACTSSKGAADTSSTAPSGVATDAAALSARVKAAVAAITSAHIRLDVTLAAQPLTGEGDEKLVNGKLVALDITENLPGGAGAIRIITVDGTTYAKLPTSMNSSGKPYLIVAANSSNSVVRQLAASLDSALSSASLGSVSTFISAARSVETKGQETVNGVTADHYSAQVEIAKLPADLPGRSELVASGLGTLPFELYIDSRGRPVQISEDLELQGETISTKSTVTGYNKPVSIKAPPASEVGT